MAQINICIDDNLKEQTEIVLDGCQEELMIKID